MQRNEYISYIIVYYDLHETYTFTFSTIYAMYKVYVLYNMRNE